MKIVLSPEAAERLEVQVAYLRDVGAAAAAERLRVRVLSFLQNHLARFPRTGLWYRIEADRIEIATVWHTSQDRHATKR